ncbi:MAG: hypothetical protein ABIP75_09240 [Pyrinomonadaceae bacterium]
MLRRLNRNYRNYRLGKDLVGTCGRILMAIGSVSVLFSQVQAAPGDYDFTFGFLGVKIDHVDNKKMYPSELAQQADGKLLMVGRLGGGLITTNRVLLRRYNSNGSVDLGFGLSGFGVAQIYPSIVSIYGDARAVAVQTDGKILVSGVVPISTTATKPVVWRFTTLGELDTSFGDEGQVSIGRLATGYPVGIAFSGGRILTIVQLSPGRWVLTRLNADGTTDTLFGDAGYADIDLDSSSAFVVNPTNRNIVIGGTIFNIAGTPTPALEQFDRNGNPDQSFGVAGVAIPDLATPACPNAQPSFVSSIGLQTDGRIIVGGRHEVPLYNDPSNNSNYIVRLGLDGALDTGFGTTGFATKCNSRTYEPILIVSRTTNQIVAVLGLPVDGTNATSFRRYSAGGLLNLVFPASRATDLLIQTADDKVVTVEWATPTGDVRLARFLQ